MSPTNEINHLISTYNFPLAVLQDVTHRIECCQEEHYVGQQLRYLQNLIQHGLATKK